VTESVVVDRNHKLVALVYSDPSLAKADVLQGRTVEEVMKENMVKANKLLPNYSQLTAIELVEKEFEKTPKRSIKRFMYK
jgi:long-chain acyl-CoA synthetase